MVFEVMLAKILEGYLGDYIENLDTKNLRVALWGGNVELENLRFKSSALADVSSSLSVKAGFLRKLKLFVPWNSFYTQTVKVEVDGLYLLIVPKSDVKYDREKVENENYDIKMRQIRRVEIMRKEQENMALQQKDNVDISKETNTFAERLQMHIVRNLDLTIKNIHIRMEDQSTKPNSPFTFGLTLSTIQLKTTDENWQPATLASDAPFVNKLVEVVKFSLYWNSSDKCLSQLPNDKIINELENLIPNDQTTTAMDFILSPMSVDAKLKMDTKPKLKNFKEPMIILNTTLKTIRLNLITSQYFDMLDFMEAYEFRSKTFKYAPYRHWLEEGEASRSKRRWKFAIDAILDDTVKPKFDCWKWENMKIHLKMCREYRKLFVRESTNKLSDVDAARMRELELKLNIFNLTLVRSSAQKEVDKRLEDLQKKKTWGAWVQSFWKQEEETVELSEEVTEAEKSKLFEAIGYVGDETSYSSYPKEYIQAVAEFTLSELSLTFWKSLNNGRSSKGNTQILTAQVLDSFVKLSRRPTLNAFKTDLQMKEVRFLGLDEGNGPAPLVVTNETGSVNDALLSASFETNPMNSDAKFFFGANCSSVGIYYHSESINCLVSSFVTRDRKQLSSMKAAAYSTYVEAKQRTKLLLKHNLEHVKLLDIDIYLRSSYFILPNLGKYSKNCSLFCLDFGDFSLKRNDNMMDYKITTNAHPNMDKALIDLQQSSYTRFRMELTNFQLLFADKGDDWTKSRLSAITPLHVISPISIKLDLAKCFYTDDINLPAFHVRGNIPEVSVTFSERRVHTALEVLRKMPIPKLSDKKQEMTIDTHEEESSIANELKDVEKIPIKQHQTDKRVVQLINLVAEFLVEQVKLSILRQDEGGHVPFLTFTMSKIGGIARFKTFEMVVNMHLNSVQLRNEDFITSDDSPLLMISTPVKNDDIDHKLITATCVIADPKGPYFKSDHENVKSKFNVQFARLAVVLQQESLRTILAFQNQFTKDLNDFFDEFGQEQHPTTNYKATKNVITDPIHEEMQTTPIIRQKTKTLDIIGWKAYASLEEFSLQLSNRHSAFLVSNVLGLNMDITSGYKETHYTIDLQSFYICNPSKTALHKKIVGPKNSISDLVHASIVMYDRDDSIDKVDCEINARFSKIECCFLMKSLRQLMDFLDEFSFAKEAVEDASRAYAAMSLRELRNLSDKAFRLKLNIDIKAPAIYIPQNSKSNDCFLMDLGRISICTQFASINPDCSIIEIQNIIFHDVHASRLLLNHEQRQELSIVNCDKMEIEVRRKLTEDRAKSIPNIACSVNWKRVQLVMSKGDFKFIMKLLSENLHETPVLYSHPDSNLAANMNEQFFTYSNKAIEEAQADFQNRMNEIKRCSAVEASKSDGIYIQCNVNIGEVSMIIYSNDEELTVSDKRCSSDLLSSMTIKATNVRYILLLNNNWSLKTSMLDLTADDCRPARASRRRVINRHPNVEQDRKMIEIRMNSSSVDGQQHTTIDGTLVRLYVSFSFNFIQTVQDFFLSGLACYNPPPEAVAVSDHDTFENDISTVKTKITKHDTMNVTFVVENSEVILVESMDRPNCNCLVMEMNTRVQYKVIDSESQLIVILKKLSIYCSSLADYKLQSSTNESNKYRVLEPIDIIIDGLITNKIQKYSVSLSTIVLSMAPIAIRTAISVTSSISESEIRSVTESVSVDYDQIWNPIPKSKWNFWFLEGRKSKLIQSPICKQKIDQELNFSCPGIYFKIELGLSSRTLPLLATEFTDVWFDISNWSDSMKISGQLILEMAAYNDHAGGWESVIEAAEIPGEDNKFAPCQMIISSSDLSNIDFRTHEFTRYISFPNGIQISLSCSSSRLLYRIYQSFCEAYSSIPEGSSDDLLDPLSFENCLGERVKLKGLTDIEVKCQNAEAVVEPNHRVALFSKGNSFCQHSIIMPNSIRQRQEVILTVRGMPIKLNITRSLPRVYNIMGSLSPICFLCETTCIAEKRIVRIRGTLKIQNNTPLELSLIKHLGNNQFHHIDKILNGQEYFPSLDTLFDSKGFLYFLDNGSKSEAQINWTSEVVKLLKFQPQADGSLPMYIQAYRVESTAFKENSDYIDSKLYTLVLNPCVSISNLLPTSLYMKTQRGVKVEINAGDTIPLINYFLPCQLSLKFNGLFSEEWIALLKLSKKIRGALVLPFKDSSSKYMHLAAHIELINEAMIVKIFSPYWILNKTQYDMSLKMNGKSEPSLILAENCKIPYMLPCKDIDKSQRKAHIKIAEGDWSDKFSLDAIGNATSLQSKRSQNRIYEIGMNITVSTCGLTKILNFTPFFTILNRLESAVEIKEFNNKGAALTEDWALINPNEIIPFWPNRPNKQQSFICVRHFKSRYFSAAFYYDQEHSTLLRMQDSFKSVIKVDCIISEMGANVIFSNYKQGSAPLLALNCGKINLTISQTGIKKPTKVKPGEGMMFAWPNPIGIYTFNWQYGAYTKEDTELIDQNGEFLSVGDNRYFWAIFMYLDQRIFCITDDENVIKRATKSFHGDKVISSFIIQFYSMSLSLVNDFHRQEILFLSITSSKPNWYEIRTEKSTPIANINPSNLKLLDKPLNSQLEIAYKEVMKEMCDKKSSKIPKLHNVGNKQKLDVRTMRLYDGDGGYRDLCRKYHDAVWLKYVVTTGDVYFHIKVYKLQIDNQLSTAIFPVIFYSVTPKNAFPSEIDRPLIEVCAVKSSSPDVVLIKQLHILIQEFAVEMDQSLLGSLLNFFSIETEIKGQACLSTDIKYCENSLLDMILVSTDTIGSEIILNLCHISPLKIHFSFSMHTSKTGSTEELLRKYPAVDFFLQTFNIAEVQDCVLQLGFYHRVNYRTTQTRLISEILGHYQHQVIKQIYVIMFGLDAFGNPFGLLRGVGQGIESLFYEPYKGWIEGPGEFAEGIVLGVRNLFGGVIGSASNVASKITGTVGKGLAQLTFDDDYKSKRLRTKTQDQTVRQTFAQGSRGVWMGFYEGFTGIVKKPMEGIKSEGAEGFVKGLGKGMIGLVTRPIGGVVDLANAGFEGVKKLSALESTTKRVRIPRFIDFDCLCRPYRQHEAIGNRLFMEVDDNVLKQTDVYAAHITCTTQPANSWLLATNRQLIMIIGIEIFNQTQIQWKHTYEEMTNFPQIVDDKNGNSCIMIQLKEYIESSNIFRTVKGYGRVVYFQNRTNAQLLCNKVKGYMQDQGIDFD